MLAAVVDDGRALGRARVEVRGDLVAVLARHERPHLGRSDPLPGPTLIFGSRALDRVDERVGHVADGDDRR